MYWYIIAGIGFSVLSAVAITIASLRINVRKPIVGYCKLDTDKLHNTLYGE